ncbi:unnamed protein product [Arctia plantaginis]|uniref:Protein sleepless n=1 Tax=Arctia plantaginis TaxID=874455 RepID=A0A8S1B4C4_ARCPL|nr:unnamed protein product [Arctia plantaginis]
MSIQKFIIISVTILLTLFEIGTCLRCYECTTTRHQSCADPYKKTNNYIHDCTIKDTQCGKLIIETPEGDVIVRHCFNPFINCETVIAKTNALTTNEKIKHCSSCHGDLCNGATSVSLSIFFTIVILFGTCLYYK